MIWLYGIYTRNSFFQSIKSSFHFFFGVIAGSAIILLLMHALGHLNLFVEAIERLINISKTPNHTHSFNSLLKVYAKNYFQILQGGIHLILVIGFFIGVFHVLRNHLKLFILFFVFIVFGLLYTGYYTNFINKQTWYFLGFLFLVPKLFNKNASIQLKLLSFSGIFMVIILPLGSDGGIDNLGTFTLWLSMPIIVSTVINNLNGNFKIQLKLEHSKPFINIIIPQIWLKLIISLPLLLLLNYSFIRIYNRPYFDPGPITQKKYLINNKYANYIYTTKERADILNPLLFELEKYVSPNDYLLVFDKTPIIHFFTNTRPYVKNPWISLSDSNYLQNALIKAKAELPTLPVIVVQKFLSYHNWTKPDSTYLTLNPNALMIKEVTAGPKRAPDIGRNRALLNFINENGYAKIWTNEYFDIYISESQSSN